MVLYGGGALNPADGRPRGTGGRRTVPTLSPESSATTPSTADSAVSTSHPRLDEPASLGDLQLLADHGPVRRQPRRREHEHAQWHARRAREVAPAREQIHSDRLVQGEAADPVEEASGVFADRERRCRPDTLRSPVVPRHPADQAYQHTSVEGLHRHRGHPLPRVAPEPKTRGRHVCFRCWSESGCSPVVAAVPVHVAAGPRRGRRSGSGSGSGGGSRRACAHGG